MEFGFEAGGRKGVVGAKEVYVVPRAGIPGCKDRRQEGTRAAPEVARVRGESYSLQETVAQQPRVPPGAGPPGSSYGRVPGQGPRAGALPALDSAHLRFPGRCACALGALWLIGGRSVLRGGHGNSRPRVLSPCWSVVLVADVGAIPRSLGGPLGGFSCCPAASLPRAAHIRLHTCGPRAPSCVTCRGGRGLPGAVQHPCLSRPRRRLPPRSPALSAFLLRALLLAPQGTLGPRSDKGFPADVIWGRGGRFVEYFRPPIAKSVRPQTLKN